MTIEEDMDEISQLLTDKLGGQEALDRIVRERDEWKDHAEVFGSELRKLRKERDELREALREIATLTWNPAIGLPATSDSDLHNIARSVLQRTEEEVTATPNRP